jgi:hypothetical protein
VLDPQPEQIAPRRFWAPACLALGLGLAGQALLVLRPAEFSGHPFRRPWVLASVHLTSLGLLGLLFLIVLLNAAGVLHHRNVSESAEAKAGPWLFATGAVSLACFFGAYRSPWLLGFALAALAAGYAATFAALARQLRGVLYNTDAKRGSAQGLVALGVVLLLGAAMAPGLLGQPLPFDALAVLRFHIHLGLAGFAGLALAGLLPKLLRLFQGSTGYWTGPTRVTFMAVHAGLCLEAAAIVWPRPSLPPLASACFLTAALAHTLQIGLLLRKARKRRFDSSLSLQLAALLWLQTAAGLGLAYSLGGAWRLAAAATYAALFGWVGGSILGTLQRVVAVLAWFQRFYAHSATQAVPTAWELIHPGLAWAAGGLHLAAAGAGVLGLLNASKAALFLSGCCGAASILATVLLVAGAHKRGRARPFEI